MMISCMHEQYAMSEAQIVSLIKPHRHHAQ